MITTAKRSHGPKLRSSSSPVTSKSKTVPPPIRIRKESAIGKDESSFIEFPVSPSRWDYPPDSKARLDYSIAKICAYNLQPLIAQHLLASSHVVPRQVLLHQRRPTLNALYHPPFPTSLPLTWLLNRCLEIASCSKILHRIPFCLFLDAYR